MFLNFKNNIFKYSFQKLIFSAKSLTCGEIKIQWCNFLATFSMKLISSLSNLRQRWKIELLIKKSVYIFILVLSTPFGGGNSWHLHRKKMTNGLLVDVFFLPTKICCLRHPHFLWKTRSTEELVHSCFVEINLLFPNILNIFKKISVMGFDFSKFLLSAAIVKIVVLLGKIFPNLQTNNYMTSPVLISLIILGICEESQVAFSYCTDSILVVNYKICRDVLRTQSNIYDGAFLQQ